MLEDTAHRCPVFSGLYLFLLCSPVLKLFVVLFLFVLNSFRMLFGGVPLESGLAGNESGFRNLEFV